MLSFIVQCQISPTDGTATLDGCILHVQPALCLMIFPPSNCLHPFSHFAIQSDRESCNSHGLITYSTSFMFLSISTICTVVGNMKENTQALLLTNQFLPSSCGISIALTCSRSFKEAHIAYAVAKESSHVDVIGSQ